MIDRRVRGEDARSKWLRRFRPVRVLPPLAFVLLIAPLEGQQRVAIVPEFAVRLPASGTVAMPIPRPSMSGYPYDYERFRETGAVVVAARVDIRSRGPLLLVTGGSFEHGQRIADTDRFQDGCWDGCTSQQVALHLGLAARASGQQGASMRVGIGAEWIHLFGEAYDRPVGHTGSVANSIRSEKRAVVGGVASFGAAHRLPSGSEVRLDIRLRRYGVRYAWPTNSTWATVYPSPRTSPFDDIRVGIGWRPRG